MLDAFAKSGWFTVEVSDESDYWKHRDPKKLAGTVGEWNEMKIRVVGGHVTTWLNGTEMVDLIDEAIGRATGHIALQIHDGGGIKVKWRNLRVTAFPVSGPT